MLRKGKIELPWEVFQYSQGLMAPAIKIYFFPLSQDDLATARVSRRETRAVALASVRRHSGASLS